MQRAARPSRPFRTGAAVYSLVLEAQGIGKCDATAGPNDPTGLTATASGTSTINLAWDADLTPSPNQATYWGIEWSANGSTGWTPLANASTNAYSDTGLPASTTRYYRVTAYNCYGASALTSNVANATTNAATIPNAPTGVSASASTTAVAVTVTWTDASTDETGFYVYRNTSNTTTGATLLSTLSAGVQTYTDNATNSGGNAPAEGTTYYYWVSAYNGAGESAKTAASQNATGGVTTAIIAEWTLDFSSGTPSGYTLTRASSGTYVDSSGYIATQASGTSGNSAARLTHNSSGSRLGLLVEESRTNVVHYSEDFTNQWTTLGITVTANQATAPDNATTGDEIKDGSPSGQQVIIDNSAAITSGTTYTFTVYAKQNTAKWFQIGGRGTPFGTNEWANFDLNAGTVGNVGTSVSGSDATITAVGNGWYRCKLTMVAVGNATGGPYIGLTDNTNSGTRLPTYLGTGKGVYIWGAQLEAAATETSYIKTPSNATVTRSADLAHVLDSSITSWGNPGALVIHFYPPGQAGTLLSTDDASAAQLGLQASSTTAARAFWSNGQTSTGTIAAGVNKAVHYWNGTASSFCINGGTVQTGTNNVTTFGNIDFVTFGAEATDSSGSPGTFSQWSNLVIRKIEFYSGTLTNSNLQTITT
jgi:hypothetical protein